MGKSRGNVSCGILSRTNSLHQLPYSHESSDADAMASDVASSLGTQGMFVQKLGRGGVEATSQKQIPL